MKNIEKMLIAALIIGSMGFLPSQAGTAELLKKTQGPGFELYNKASNTITAAVLVDGKLTTQDVPSNKKFLLTVDTSKPVRLGIYNQPTKNVSKAWMSEALTPQPNAVYELNASGKTKYVTWNPSKSPALYPQTGTLMGLSGKSDSGYPLVSNLGQSQIIVKK
jgi:hypothetical protein